MSTRLPLRYLLSVLLLGGCATPLLNIPEPTQEHVVEARKKLDGVTLPESPWPMTFQQLKEGHERASGKILFAAVEVYKRLKPRIEAVRCSALFTVPEIHHSKQVNAFADHNDNIAVFTGLLFRMREESELAAVLAHEYAHIMLGHVEKKMTNTAAGMR